MVIHVLPPRVHKKLELCLLKAKHSVDRDLWEQRIRAVKAACLSGSEGIDELIHYLREYGSSDSRAVRADVAAVRSGQRPVAMDSITPELVEVSHWALLALGEAAVIPLVLAYEVETCPAAQWWLLHTIAELESQSAIGFLEGIAGDEYLCREAARALLLLES